MKFLRTSEPGKDLAEYVANAVKQGIYEGGQEGVAGIMQNAIAQGYSDEVRLLQGVAEEAGYGAGVGATVQMVADLIVGRRARGTRLDTDQDDVQGEGELLDAVATPSGPDRFAIDVDRNDPDYTGALQEQADMFGGRDDRAAPTRSITEPELSNRAQDTRTQDLFEAAAVDDAVSALESEQQRARQRSDTESADARVETQRQQETQQRRDEVLRTVIESVPTRNYGTLINNAKQALGAVGITNTQLTESEERMLRRAVDVQRAEPASREAPTAPPQDTDVNADVGSLEAAIPERKAAQEPQQLGIANVGQRRDATTEPTPQIKVVTPLLDRLNIRNPSIRADLGEGTRVPESKFRENLLRVANYAKTSQRTKQAITSYLDGVPENQGTLPLIRGQGNGRQDRTGDAGVRPTGPADAGSSVPGAGLDGARGEQPTQPVPTPDRPRPSAPAVGGRAVADDLSSPAPVDGGEAAQRGALTESVTPAESVAPAESVTPAESVPPAEPAITPAKPAAKEPSPQAKAQRKRTAQKRVARRAAAQEELQKAKQAGDVKQVAAQQRVIDRIDDVETRNKTATQPAKQGSDATAKTKAKPPSKAQPKAKAAPKQKAAPAKKAPAAKKPAERKAPTKKSVKASPEAKVTQQKTAGERNAEAAPRRGVAPTTRDTVEDLDVKHALKWNNNADPELRAYMAITDAAVVPADQKNLLKDDKVKISRLDETAKGEAKAAYDLFNALPFMDKGLDMIAYYLGPRVTVSNSKGALGKDTTAIEDKYYRQFTPEKAKKAAAWVRKNLSDKAKNALEREIRRYEVMQSGASMNEATRNKPAGMNPKKSAKLVNKALYKDYSASPAEQLTVDEYYKRRAAEEGVSVSDIKPPEVKEADNEQDAFDALMDDVTATEYDVDAVSSYDLDDFSDLLELRIPPAMLTNEPLHPVAFTQLQNGNVLGALRTIALTTANSRTADIAQALTNTLSRSNTTQEVIDNLKGEDGVPTLGRYDPKANTIQLDAENGLKTIHTLLHEAAHAATSHKLSDAKSQPEVKQLKELYERIKETLGESQYALKTIDEFTAEVFSNTDFQQQLAQMKETGEPVTLLTKVKRAIGNLLRKLVGMSARRPETALDAADKFIYAIMSPAPDSRNAGALNSRALENNTESLLDKNRAKKRPWSQQKDMWVESVSGSTLTDKVQASLLTLPNTQQLGDIAKSMGFKNAEKLAPMIETLHNSVNKLAPTFDVQLKSLKTWQQKNPEKSKELAEVVRISTLEEVDPRKNQSVYKDDADKLAVYKTLKPRYDRMGKEAQDAYNSINKTYRKLFDEFFDAMDTRIDELVDDKAEARRIKNRVTEELKKKQVDPYFALVRPGEYWMSYNDPETGEWTVTTFDSADERIKFAQALRDTVQEVKKDAVERYKAEGKPEDKAIMLAGNIDLFKRGQLAQKWRTAPDDTFVGDIFRSLNKNVTNDAQKDAVVNDVMASFLQILPESSVAKAMRKREGTAGFEVDPVAALQEKAYSLASTASKLRATKELRALLADFGEQKKKDKLNEEVFKALESHITFAASPPMDLQDRLATKLNQVGFIGTIGFNLSSAIVNGSQIPLIIMPMLGAKYGIKESGAAAAKANRLYGNSATGVGSKDGREVELFEAFGDTKSMKERSFYSIDNYYTLKADGSLERRADLDEYLGKNAKKITKLLDDYGMDTLVNAANARGMFRRSLVDEQLADMDEFGRKSSFGRKFSHMSAYVFHEMERFNRQFAMSTAYMLELDKLRADPKNKDKPDSELQKLAATDALYNAQELNGGNITATLPTIAKHGLMRSVMMYKPYGMAMYYLLFKTMKRAFDKNLSPEDKKIARKQLAGITGSSFLLAGAQGLPFYGAVGALYNMFFVEDDEEDWDTMNRKFMGEMAYKGLASELTGVDVASRMGLSDLLFRHNPFADSQSLEEQLFSHLGPAVSVGMQGYKGAAETIEALNNGDTRGIARGVERGSPAALRNLLKAGRISIDDAYLTRRGDPIVDDLNTSDIFLQAVGFAPVEYTYAQEKSRALKKLDRAVADKRTGLAKRYYVALRFQDYALANDIIDEMVKFNEKHGDKGAGVAISRDYIERSLKAHVKSTKNMRRGVSYSPNIQTYLDFVDYTEWE
ncbi:MAG TPA: PLxRFG domain-containing protein [Candidatus Paceibacterota bacterium]|nr:PLxRFG domain-containing protein [Candidatus Paceibacterota bacterium]